jgi:adenylate cyclase
LVERLAAQPGTLRLGGEERELTLMFSDIRGFTGVSETMTPEQLTRFMNQFLTPMTEEVLSHSGFIDKYMGDAIMAFWNAPVSIDDHPMQACRTALAMRRRLQDLNAAWKLEFDQAGRTFPGVAIGIGLNTNICCVGNLGSEQRFDYSALGDGVNLASRLEGQSKTYGVDVVLNETTHTQCGDRIASLELDLIRVKGKQTPARIFTLVGDGALWNDRSFAAFTDRHREMIAAYRGQEWERAETAVEVCRETVEARPDWLPAGLDLARLYALYSTRIAELRADPPPADWDAVFEPGTK